MRENLAAQLSAAQSELESHITELTRSGSAAPASVMAEAQGQLAGLIALARSLSAASPSALQSMQGHVIASVAAASAIAQTTREAATNADRVHMAHMQAVEVNRATRETVTALADDLYERRVFDPYLKFASEEEEAAYRQREARNKQYIHEQMEKNTPESNLNAAAATADQMLDANAHGAGKSPDFAPRWQRLREDLRMQRDMVRAEGLSTEEADRRVEAGVRRLLKKKGVPEAEIDTKLATTTDPLDVAEQYMQGVGDAEALQAELEAGAKKQAQVEPTVSTSEAVKQETPTTISGLDALAATLQGSGVTLTQTGTPEGHGVNAAAIPPPAAERTV